MGEGKIKKSIKILITVICIVGAIVFTWLTNIDNDGEMICLQYECTDNTLSFVESPECQKCLSEASSFEVICEQPKYNEMDYSDGKQTIKINPTFYFTDQDNHIIGYSSRELTVVEVKQAYNELIQTYQSSTITGMRNSYEECNKFSLGTDCELNPEDYLSFCNEGFFLVETTLGVKCIEDSQDLDKILPENWKTPQCRKRELTEYNCDGLMKHLLINEPIEEYGLEDLYNIYKINCGVN